jgi:hypothetical protein
MPFFVSKYVVDIIGLTTADRTDISDEPSDRNYYYFVPTLSATDIEREFYPVAATDPNPTEPVDARARENVLTELLRQSGGPEIRRFNTENNELLSELRACCQRKDAIIASLQLAQQRLLESASSEIIDLVHEKNEIANQLEQEKMMTRTGITLQNIRSAAYHKANSGLSVVLFGALHQNFDEIIIFYECMFGVVTVEETISKFEQFLFTVCMPIGFQGRFLQKSTRGVLGISAV